MNQAIASVVRVLVVAALGGLVAKGWLTADDVERVTSYITGIAGIAVMSVWAILRNRLTPMLDRLASQPEVKEIVVDSPEVANASPSPKVVATSDLPVVGVVEIK